MLTSPAYRELSIAALDALTGELHARAPRPGAADEIEITPVPMRTCYETMTRLVGPRDAVLDYAAFLFTEGERGEPTPVPPLTIEEGHEDPEHGELSLVLSRGSFIAG